MATPLAVPESLRTALYDRGFDICVPFHPAWYNEQLDTENIDTLMRLPVQNVEAAYLIGNTKHLWSIFIDWCRARDTQDGASGLPAHPLDTYCREHIPAIVNSFHKCTVNTIHWSWDYGDDKLVSVQRVAVVSGFAYHDVHTQVTVHPRYGVWKAYRAVVLCRSTTKAEAAAVRSCIPRPPPRQPNLLSKTEEDNAGRAMQHALSLSDLDAMWQLMQERSTDVMTTEEDEHQLVLGKAWIAVRDAVERGKQDYRYTYHQLMYHYIKNVKYIQAAMAEQSSSTTGNNA